MLTFKRTSSVASLQADRAQRQVGQDRTLNEYEIKLSAIRHHAAMKGWRTRRKNQRKKNRGK